MNVRNIMSFALLSGLLATAQSQCMMSLVNKTIQKVGTMVGVGLAAGPIVKGGLEAGYAVHTDPESACVNTEVMSAEDQKFYKETVIDNPKIRLRTTEVTDNAYACGDVIVMPETITTPQGIIALRDAIAKNDTRALDTFKGVCEHERQHNRNGDNYAIAAEYVATPIIATTAAAIILKKTLPMSQTNRLAEQIVRSTAKIGAGSAASGVNKEITERVVAHRRRKKEYAADQGVSHEHREDFINFLTTSDNNGFRAAVQEQYPDLTEAQRNVVARKIQEQYYQSPLATHPAPWDRAAALYPTKKS